MSNEENNIVEIISIEHDDWTKSTNNICPDYDQDCKIMSVSHANWCFMGCENNPCGLIVGIKTLGIAEGQCPIINPNN